MEGNSLVGDLEVSGSVTVVQGSDMFNALVEASSRGGVVRYTCNGKTWSMCVDPSVIFDVKGGSVIAEFFLKSKVGGDKNE